MYLLASRDLESFSKSLKRLYIPKMIINILILWKGCLLGSRDQFVGIDGVVVVAVVLDCDGVGDQHIYFIAVDEDVRFDRVMVVFQDVYDLGLSFYFVGSVFLLQLIRDCGIAEEHGYDIVVVLTVVGCQRCILFRPRRKSLILIVPSLLGDIFYFGYGLPSNPR